MCDSPATSGLPWADFSGTKLSTCILCIQAIAAITFSCMHVNTYNVVKRANSIICYMSECQYVLLGLFRFPQLGFVDRGHKEIM